MADNVIPGLDRRTNESIQPSYPGNTATNRQEPLHDVSYFKEACKKYFS